MTVVPVVVFVRRVINCDVCDGKGKLVDRTAPYGAGFGVLEVVTPCAACHGTGFVTRRAVRS